MEKVSYSALPPLEAGQWRGAIIGTITEAVYHPWNLPHPLLCKPIGWNSSAAIHL